MTLAAFEANSSTYAPPSSGAGLRLHDRSDEELDGLSFGVICLARDGVIRRYNLAEARFARLDRAQVLGRHFFQEIAPCTATPGFQGKVDAFLAAGSRSSERFEYVFHFRFGAQLVDVELVSSANPDEIYICINRRKSSPLSEDVPSEILAAAQSDLAPNETELGVLRDEDGRRRVRLSPIVFEALAHALDDEHWATVCDGWGFSWGRLATVDIETEVILSLDSLLRDLPMSTAVDTVVRYLRREGWGQLTVDFAPARQGLMVLELERNALAEALGAATAPRCHLLSGFFRAIFSHLAGRRVQVGEVSCRTQGADRCTFAVAGARRADQLAAALAEASGDMAVLLASMGRAR